VSECRLSDDGFRRYYLDRFVASEGGSVCWVMLNPSTADATEDDATIRKVMGFTKRWGYALARVVNLFSVRGRDPRAILFAADPVGRENDWHVRDTIESSSLTVAAWGAHGDDYPERVVEVSRFFGTKGAVCLGVTKSGQPLHPLMVPYGAQRRGWSATVAFPTQPPATTGETGTRETTK
jgi:hypothetical protein